VGGQARGRAVVRRQLVFVLLINYSDSFLHRAQLVEPLHLLLSLRERPLLITVKTLKEGFDFRMQRATIITSLNWTSALVSKDLVGDHLALLLLLNKLAQFIVISPILINQGNRVYSVDMPVLFR